VSDANQGGVIDPGAPGSRLQAVVDALFEALIVTNADGIIDTFNAAASRMFAYPAADVIGHDFRMLLAETDCSQRANFLQIYLSTKADKTVSQDGGLLGKRRDGSVFPIELRVNQACIEGEQLFVATIRDTIERCAVGQLAAAEVVRTQAIMNTVVDGLITIDHAGVIETFNPAAGRIFGYPVKDVIGRNIRMLMPEPYHSAPDGFPSGDPGTADPKVIGLGREVRGRRRDGGVFPMDLGVSETNVAGRQIFVGTVRDITERKRSESAMRESIAALSRSNQELDEFAYIASHDLREPLRGLSNNAQYLKEDFGDIIGESGGRRIARIFFLCQRLEHLINDLLYFSRLGRQDLAIRSTDLNTVIADIELTLEASLEEANAKILVAEPLPVIRCDLPRITEAFRNLIANAIKYNDKPEKRIEIGSTWQDGRHVFHVRDNGIGIPAQFHGDIFRIFKRLNDEDEKVRGSGVGLTLVKKIIERQGGKIWLESEVGVGTTFYFFIEKLQET
jgi:two-component system sensor kinase FixL